MNTFGNPLVVIPRYACGTSAHASSMSSPLRPTTSSAARNLVVVNPVARMMVSTSRVVPSAVTIPCSVTSVIASVTSSTCGRLNVG